MKIGYLLEQGVGIRKRPFSGPANHVYHVVRGLEARGHQIRLLTREGDRIWKSDNLEDFEPVHVRGADDGPWHLLERVTRRIQSLLRVPYFGYFEAERLPVPVSKNWLVLICSTSATIGWGLAVDWRRSA